MRARTVALVTAVFGLMTTAQVRADDPQQDKQKVCADVKTLNSAISNLDNLDQNSTVEEAKMAEKRVDKAITSLEKSAKKAKPEQYKQLTEAHKDYQKALEEAPKGATLGQVEGKISSSRARMDQAYQDIKKSINCPEHLQQ
jgi:Tfp pilus assembly protein PilF